MPATRHADTAPAAVATPGILLGPSASFLVASGGQRASISAGAVTEGALERFLRSTVCVFVDASAQVRGIPGWFIAQA